MLLRFRSAFGLVVIFVLLLLVSGCASAPKVRPAPRPVGDHRDEIETLMLGDIGKVDSKVLESYLKTDTDLEHYRHHRMRQLRREIPREIDARVRWWIYYYAIREHDLFQRMLDRGAVYRHMIIEQLNKNLMPPELYNLAMIESGFVLHAKSHAEAAGIWQLISGTGVRYGLHVDQYTDDRNHPLLATQAALRHLLDLRRKFKSWYLVLAAYNAGPERIAKAIRRGRSNDFWVLARKHALPRETMDYIPKFMACVILSSHYEVFGFHRPIVMEPYPDLVAVQVKPGVSLARLARKGSIQLGLLRRMNSQLRSGTIPPVRRRAQVWVPAESAEAFRTAIARGPRRARRQLTAHARTRKSKRVS